MNKLGWRNRRLKERLEKSRDEARTMMATLQDVIAGRTVSLRRLASVTYKAHLVTGDVWMAAEGLVNGRAEVAAAKAGRRRPAREWRAG